MNTTTRRGVLTFGLVPPAFAAVIVANIPCNRAPVATAANQPG